MAAADFRPAALRTVTERLRALPAAPPQVVDRALTFLAEMNKGIAFLDCYCRLGVTEDGGVELLYHYLTLVFGVDARQNRIERYSTDGAAQPVIYFSTLAAPEETLCDAARSFRCGLYTQPRQPLCACCRFTECLPPGL
jgi:hypothetical protein